MSVAREKALRNVSLASRYGTYHEDGRIALRPRREIPCDRMRSRLELTRARNDTFAFRFMAPAGYFRAWQAAWE